MTVKTTHRLNRPTGLLNGWQDLKKVGACAIELIWYKDKSQWTNNIKRICAKEIISRGSL